MIGGLDMCCTLDGVHGTGALGWWSSSGFCTRMLMNSMNFLSWTTFNGFNLFKNATHIFWCTGTGFSDSKEALFVREGILERWKSRSFELLNR